MKNILGALFLMFLFSCNRSNLEGDKTKINYNTSSTYNSGVIMYYNIDNHKYIGNLRGANTDWATHSGDCTNPIHETTFYLVSAEGDTLKISK